MSTAKFEGATAERWSDAAYADSQVYLGHRANVVCALGPSLEPGDRVLDLACGDGGLGELLLERGLSYTGVDASASMVAAARRRLGEAAAVVEGTLDEYTPDAPVAATTVFRAVYYARDRAAFFRHVAQFTEKKLVFDLNPRRYSLDEVRAELRRAGFARLELHPFFVPQRVALPAPAQNLLIRAERIQPVASLLLRQRFSYVCAASRNDR